MKKITAALAAITISLGITVMAGVTALAEAPEAMPESVTENEERDFFHWIGDGMNWARDTYSLSRSAVAGGTEWLKESMQEWNGTVWKYLEEKKSSPDVREAWSILEDGAKHAGNVSEEAAAEAYRTVRDWVMTTNDTVDQEIASALDQMAAAAGVKEAELAECYRTVESFVTSNAKEITDSTVEAWNIMKKANVEGVRIAKEEVTEAYTEVHNWILGLSNENSDMAREALEHIMVETEDRN